jgi:hypothetical protein
VAGDQATRLADGDRQAQVAEASPALERPGDVEPVRGARTGGEGSAQSNARTAAPAGIYAERRIAWPHPAGIEEDGTAQIDDFPRRPTNVDAVFERHDETATAGKALTVISADPMHAAERELEWGPCVPRAGEGSAEEQRLPRQLCRLQVREQLTLEVNVFPFRFAGRRRQIAARVRPSSRQCEYVAELEAGVNRERRVEVVIRLE